MGIAVELKDLHSFLVNPAVAQDGIGKLRCGNWNARLVAEGGEGSESALDIFRHQIDGEIGVLCEPQITVRVTANPPTTGARTSAVLRRRELLRRSRVS